MKSSQILRKAQEKLRKGNTTFICLAIEGGQAIRSPQVRHLVYWIERMLEGLSVSQWLRHNFGILATGEELLEYRLAWLSYLIEICEKEGD